MNRRQNFQTIAWFNDIYNRNLLELDPPYQRRSVWTQSFKDYFIETILLDYPAPTIFLYEEIQDNGTTTYNVVDGKQRLSSLFAFIKNEFPISEKVQLNNLRGIYFSDLSPEVKNAFWSYTFSVEYLPSNNLGIINNIFDRINRNVAKLTSQELRHAKYSGVFITAAEDIADWTFNRLPNNFPQIAIASKSQMKDVEFISQILLRIENEPKSYNTDELDIEFGLRDDEWENKVIVVEKFKVIINIIKNILESDDTNIILRSRMKNQADFYSLVGSIHLLLDENRLPSIDDTKNRLIRFVDYQVTNESPIDIKDYYEYSRVASNRTLARKERERIIKSLLLNEIEY
jgi:hypothetical protein